MSTINRYEKYRVKQAIIEPVNPRNIPSRKKGHLINHLAAPTDCMISISRFLAKIVRRMVMAIKNTVAAASRAMVISPPTLIQSVRENSFSTTPCP